MLRPSRNPLICGRTLVGLIYFKNITMILKDGALHSNSMPSIQELFFGKMLPEKKKINFYFLKDLPWLIDLSLDKSWTKMATFNLTNMKSTTQSATLLSNIVLLKVLSTWNAPQKSATQELKSEIERENKTLDLTIFKQFIKDMKTGLIDTKEWKFLLSILEFMIFTINITNKWSKNRSLILFKCLNNNPIPILINLIDFLLQFFYYFHLI